MDTRYVSSNDANLNLHSTIINNNAFLDRKEIDLENLGVEYYGKVKIWENKCQIKVSLARFAI